jgi:hypothetical protein
MSATFSGTTRTRRDEAFADHHVYLIALSGLATFYGLDRMAKTSRSEREGAPVRDGRAAEEQGASTDREIFWIHIGCSRPTTPLSGTCSYGRWVLVVAVLVGFGVGLATELSKAALAVLTGFLAEGVILNVLKEEVPSERRSRFWAFAIGMAGCASLLLTL